MQQSNAVVSLGNTRFRIEKVNERYTIAVPVDDPQWLMRRLELHCLEKAAKDSSMNLLDDELEALIVARVEFNTCLGIQRNLEEVKEALVDTLYEKLRLRVPGMSRDDMRGFLERPMENGDATVDSVG